MADNDNPEDRDNGAYGFGLKEFADMTDADVASAPARMGRMHVALLKQQGENPFSEENRARTALVARAFGEIVAHEVDRARKAKGAG